VAESRRIIRREHTDVHSGGFKHLSAETETCITRVAFIDEYIGATRTAYCLDEAKLYAVICLIVSTLVFSKFCFKAYCGLFGAYLMAVNVLLSKARWRDPGLSCLLWQHGNRRVFVFHLTPFVGFFCCYEVTLYWCGTLDIHIDRAT